MSLALQEQIKSLLRRVTELEALNADMKERLEVLERKETERSKGLFGGKLTLGKS